jgi:hypothetical protein
VNGETFFTVEPGESGEWYVPTDLARGPWDPTACHGGPPAALLARASEQAVPGMRLARLMVELERPVPMAGFRIDTSVTRAGRTTATTSMEIVTDDGRTMVRARGLHVSEREVLASAVGDDLVTPRLADALPGPFPFSTPRHGQFGFREATELRYPVGEDNGEGATTVWMHTIDLLPGEAMSPFQRVCPLADCTNAFSRHRDGGEIGFVNADLYVALHRDPSGEWIGMRTASVWEPGGVALARGHLFDEHGSIGIAAQVLVLSAAP